MPTQPRRAEDDFNVGELARNIAAMTIALERINEKLDNLPSQFTPREVHDLALGGVKIDIRRIDEERGADAAELRKTARELDQRLNDQEREVARRFRQAVTITVTSVLAPLTVALVIYVLTQLAQAPR